GLAATVSSTTCRTLARVRSGCGSSSQTPGPTIASRLRILISRFVWSAAARTGRARKIGSGQAVTLSTRDRVTGAAFVVAGILLQSLLLGMPASLLSVALVIAYLVWTTESWSVRDPQLRWTYAIGIAIFVAHATEEYLTGLARRLPSLVGR